jgi:hypothetical protein
MPLDKIELEKLIKDVLETVTMDIDTVDSDGKKQTQNIKPFKDGQKIMTLETSKDVNGLDALVKVMSDKILSHLVENVETSLLERFEKLESDFDSFVIALNGAGAGPATAVPAAIATWLALPINNTVARVTDKIDATAKTLEAQTAQSAYIYGTK